MQAKAGTHSQAVHLYHNYGEDLQSGHSSKTTNRVSLSEQPIDFKPQI